MGTSTHLVVACEEPETPALSPAFPVDDSLRRRGSFAPFARVRLRHSLGAVGRCLLRPPYDPGSSSVASASSPSLLRYAAIGLVGTLLVSPSPDYTHARGCVTQLADLPETSPQVVVGRLHPDPYTALVSLASCATA